MNLLAEGHYYVHNGTGELIIVEKIDLDAGVCSVKRISPVEENDTYTQPIDYFLFNFRYHSP